LDGKRDGKFTKYKRVTTIKIILLLDINDMIIVSAITVITYSIVSILAIM
jgi:hypothetical protein